jgi:uncharacterized protein (DUF2252 family)
MAAGTIVLVGVVLVLAYIFWLAEAPIPALFTAAVAIVVGVYGNDIEAARVERDQQQQAQRAADAKPRPVSRSDDGCVVYAFKPQDRWLYFTRCEGKQTTTTNVHQECTSNGKHRRCTDVLTEVGAQ